MAAFRLFEGDEAVALHGWLTEPVVDEVAALVAKKMPRIRIDLSQLVDADKAGLALLRRLREAGVPLSNATPYFELRLG